jgi:L-lactate dehydrogenase complex protein LldE
VGFVKNYYTKLFENSSLHHEVAAISKNIFEFSDFLVNHLKITDVGASLEGKATYHDSCAALRECKIKNEPRILLANVKGLELKELEDVETCCGFGGTFAVKFEPISIAMAEQKVEHALATGAEFLISTDLSCLMHLQGYIDNKGYNLKTMHIADVLSPLSPGGGT